MPERSSGLPGPSIERAWWRRCRTSSKGSGASGRRAARGALASTPSGTTTATLEPRLLQRAEPGPRHRRVSTSSCINRAPPPMRHRAIRDAHAAWSAPSRQGDKGAAGKSRRQSSTTSTTKPLPRGARAGHAPSHRRGSLWSTEASPPAHLSIREELEKYLGTPATTTRASSAKPPAPVSCGHAIPARGSVNPHRPATSSGSLTLISPSWGSRIRLPLPLWARPGSSPSLRSVLGEARR